MNQALGTGPETGTDPIDAALDDLREQLAEVVATRKDAAERARYIRHAIENLESARARSNAPALIEDEPAEDEPFGFDSQDPAEPNGFDPEASVER